jgi:hypothetical protein
MARSVRSAGLADVASVVLRLASSGGPCVVGVVLIIPGADAGIACGPALYVSLLARACSDCCGLTLIRCANASDSPQAL